MQEGWGELQEGWGQTARKMGSNCKKDGVKLQEEKFLLAFSKKKFVYLHTKTIRSEILNEKQGNS